MWLPLFKEQETWKAKQGDSTLKYFLFIPLYKYDFKKFLCYMEAVI